MRFLDTDVIVDAVRGYPPALNWLASLPEQPGLPGFVMMEVVKGCRNAMELRRVERIVSPYSIYWPTPADCQNALGFLSQLHFSHSLGLVDALIAATAIGQEATLCTFNVKHFAAVPGLVTEQPYGRS